MVFDNPITNYILFQNEFRKKYLSEQKEVTGVTGNNIINSITLYPVYQNLLG